MAQPSKHQVRRGEEIAFADGKKRLVYPLTLKGLRKFVKILNKMNETVDITKMTDEDVELMIQASSVVLEETDPAFVENTEAVENAVDVFSFQKLMAVAMGNLSPEEVAQEKE